MSTVVDLARVRRAKEKLDEIEKAHPEAFKRLDSTTLENAMLTNATFSEQIAVRLPTAMVDWIDSWRANQCAAMPGLRLTRAEAIRMLLTAALSAKAPDTALPY